MKQKVTRASKAAQKNGANITQNPVEEMEVETSNAANPNPKLQTKAQPIVPQVEIKQEELESVPAVVESSADEEALEEGGNQDNNAKDSPPKIKNGPVAKEIPDQRVIVVKNLPRKLKQVKILEVFQKYGTITTIHIIPTPDQTSSIAYVAFDKDEEAAAALEAHLTAQIGGKPLQVVMRKTNSKQKAMEDRQKQLEEKKKQYEELKKRIEASKDRTVYVRNLKAGTTEEQLQEHFAECGTIENISLVARRSHYAFISFTENEAVKAALKLHSSVLNGLSIGVFMRGDENDNTFVKDPARTIILKNKHNLETVELEKLNRIFSQCGEIETIEILCKRVVLAFISFKHEDGAQKALQLSGTTAEDMELEIDQYKLTNKMRNTVFVQNVRHNVIEEQIRDLFAEAGPIENVVVKPGYALVRFADSDGFCKSFLLNESNLSGQMIFLEPYSEKKQNVMKSRKSYPYHHGGKKRTISGHNYKGGNPKKFKQQ